MAEIKIAINCFIDIIIRSNLSGTDATFAHNSMTIHSYMSSSFPKGTKRCNPSMLEEDQEDLVDIMND